MKTAYINGNIYTITQGFCEAFVEEKGKFVYVGKSKEALLQADRVIDLDGRFVTCGFNDSHMHVLGFGQKLRMIDLTHCTQSLQALLAGLADYIEKHDWPSDVWLKGRGWNHDYFCDEARMPTKADLDQVSRTIPIMIIRACGHVCVVNSKGLKMLGIDENTPPVAGGYFDVKTGIFKENALSLIYEHTNQATLTELKQMILQACHELNRYGITSAQTDDFTNCHVPFQMVIQAYQELAEAELLTVKINEQCQLATIAELDAFIAQGCHQIKGDYFRCGPLKLLADGSLGARTAYLSAPYEDDRSTQGIACFDQATLTALLKKAYTHQMSAAVHCIGDQAMRMVMDIYRQLLADDAHNLQRLGIVHCQITDRELLADFKKYAILAYIQPIFLDYDITIVKQRLGETRARSTYAFKTLYESGACGGSDCPVELPDVMLGIQCAITRQTHTLQGPFIPKQALSLEEALRLYTLNGAYASFEEKQKGSIEVGKAADFVVLSANPFNVAETEVQHIRVLQTVVDGKLVYRQEEN